MTNQEILEKAIKKAIEGGWQDCPEKVDYVKVANYRYEDDFANGLRLITYVVSFPSGLGFSDKASVSEIIFNQDFAKALWGDKQIGINYLDLNKIPDDIFYENPDMESGLEAPAYKYHLQQMVIAEDPIKYLGEHI